MISSTPACSLGPTGRRLAIALVLLSSSAARTGYALDWKSPTQFVGIGGMRGTYDDVQKPLDRLEWQAVHHGTEKATLSLGQLLAGQLAWRAALKNIAVDFTYNSERRAESARFKENQKQRRDLPADFAFEARVAIKGEKRYTFFRDLTPSALAKDKREKPVSKRKARRTPEFVYAFNGAQMRSLEPFRAVGHIHPAKLDAVDAQHMWYFDSLSMPTGPRAPQQMKSVWYVPTALQATSIYHVLPTLQEVDGAKCHVVTSGFDTIWIDVAHGFCIRRRVWFQMRNVADAPVLAYVYVNQDFRQFDEAIWLPQHCYRIDFAGAQEPKNTQGTLTEIHTVVAKTIDVNSVADETFDLQFPPGTAVQDLIASKSYVVPHGENLLEEAIAKANPIVNGEVKPAGILSPQSVTSKHRWLIIANLAVLSLLGARLWWRHRHSQSLDGAQR
ncbi:MAG TPA: hypothetical protein VMR25_13270 [Planctomycetaceae bacterium]|jgi:hypothetical protein|nr:hypothetical protein [Planctomycetaceae bacterium]